MIHIPASHTVFHKDVLFTVIAGLYDIGKPIASRFVSNGLNDTYSVHTDTGRFILRIYKQHWRDEDAIRFELDFILHLKERGIPVSYPIAAKDGTLVTRIDAPEGLRFAVLFSYADGEGRQTVETSRSYGRAVAELHREADSFVPQHNRFRLDGAHLLDEPLANLLPFLQHRPDDYAFIKKAAERLKFKMEQLTSDANDWGACHGDLHGWNVFHAAGGALTHFDFDCSGAGWRAYDLSVYLWNLVHGRDDAAKFKDECWDAFLEAYLSERPMSQADLDAIPLFVAIRHIWLIGLHTGFSAVWGAWQDDGYFDGKLKFLKLWLQAYDL